MATKKATEDEAKPKSPSLDKVIKQAEALLYPPVGGYDGSHESFNQGVQAVIDLLRKS